MSEALKFYLILSLQFPDAVAIINGSIFAVITSMKEEVSSLLGAKVVELGDRIFV